MITAQAELIKRLGYNFRNTELVERALTHRSLGTKNYERLEFLGDSVLEFTISAYLYEQFPDLSEGELTRLRASLVRKESLAQLARHAPYPQADAGAIDVSVEQEMDLVIEIIRSIRNARVESTVDPARYIEAWITAGDAKPALESHGATIAALARVRPLTIQEDGAGHEISRDRAKVLVLKGVEVVLPFEGMIDVDAEKDRLLKEIEGYEKEIRRIESLLRDEAFLAKAPAHIVEKERLKLNDRKDRLSRSQERVSQL